MKRKLIFNILIVLSAAGGFLSCSDTWLMYDTSQKDKLYFSDGAQSLDRYLSTEAPFALLDESVKELRQTISVKLLGMFYPGIKEVYARQMESPTWGGMFHADEFETSLLLASDKKDLVQMDKAVREYPPVPPLYGMDDSSIGVISTSGVYGDATLASAEKGEAMMEEFARRTAALIGVALAGAQG